MFKAVNKCFNNNKICYYAYEKCRNESHLVINTHTSDKQGHQPESNNKQIKQMYNCYT